MRHTNFPLCRHCDTLVFVHPKSPAASRVKVRLISLLGPAFVAAVAYVDPGNVAANITAGARYGYLLVWVLVLANAMAVIVQYQSAKLGIVTNTPLPHLLGRRLSKRSRLAFWGQAEIVAAATDIAEVIGGAIALHLLFGVPLVLGGVIVGIVSILLLAVQNRSGQRPFELVIIALLVIVTIGFLSGLAFSPPSASGVLGGLVPRFEGVGSLLVAASMLGATVMPHAIYLHSSLVRDRHADTDHDKEVLLRASRIDVTWALVIAGAVNIGLLLLAASALDGVEGTDTIEGAHAAITSALGPTVGIIFAVGLLASGLASTSVGAYAGAEIMDGLLHLKIPLVARRAITIIPALIILALGAEPTWALVLSQVILSFGIPLAIIPLMRYTRSREIMGHFADGPVLRVTSTIIAILIVALNAALIVLTVLGID